MPWSTTDIAFKKLNNKRVTTNTGKGINEERGAIALNIHAAEIWLDSVPSTPPASTTSIVQVYNYAARLTLVEDTSVATQQAWFATSISDTTTANNGSLSSESARLMDWIPDKYDAPGTVSGTGYEIKVYDKNDVLIPKADASAWFFDYQTGILMFQNANTDSGTVSSRAPFKVVGYRYIGRKGAGSVSSIGGQNGVITSLTANASITTTGNLQLDLAYSPTWTGTHTFSKELVLASPGGASGTHLKMSATGGGALTFKLDSAATATINYTLPSAQPSSGQVLRCASITGTGPYDVALEWGTPSNVITSLNGLTASSQTFATGTSGTDFNISSNTSTHTFNLPDASSTARGLVNTTTQTFGGDKTFGGNLVLSTTTSYGLRVANMPTASLPTPASGNMGAIAWDTTDGALKVSTGSTWAFLATTVGGATAVDGNGTANYVSLWVDNNTLTNSIIYQNGTDIIEVTGHIKATSKSFDIPHPTKPGYRLVYGSLEGPEHGAYHRGRESGEEEVTVVLPEYWSKLVYGDYNVQITARGDYGVFISNQDEKSFTVKRSGRRWLRKRKLDFDYVATGCRRDVTLIPEQPKS